MLEKATVETAIKYITSFQALAPLVTLGLFFIQAVLPVFPYMILAGAAGMVFGFWKGFVLAWVGLWPVPVPPSGFHGGWVKNGL